MRKNQKIKKSDIIVILFSTVIMFLAIGSGIWILNSKNTINQQLPENTEEAGKDTKVEVSSEIKGNVEEKEVKVPKIELPKVNKEQEKADLESKKNKVEQSKKYPNISGEGISQDMVNINENDTILTNKNDKMTDKEQKNKTKVQSNSSSTNSPENMILDNTPYYEAEPKQTTPIVWEDGGEAGTSQHEGGCVKSGENTNGGYLN